MKKSSKVSSKSDLDHNSFNVVNLSKQLTNISTLSEDYPHLYTACNNSSKPNVVIKSYKHYADFLNEFMIIGKIHEQNKSEFLTIPKIYGYGEALRGSYSLVMEKVEAPDLITHIQNKTLNITDILLIMKLLPLAIKFLHGLNIAHCDIKCDNILVSLTHKINEPIKITLIDFVFSILVKNNKEYVRKGTVNYMSPELYFGGGYDSKANDVWGLGVVLYILASGGYFPFVHSEKLSRNCYPNYYLNKFYKRIRKQLKYGAIDPKLVSIFKKIFVAEDKRINIIDLVSQIIPVINKILVKIGKGQVSDNAVKMSPKRHVLSFTF